MTDEPVKRYAPYLAWRTFFNLILQLEEKGLPTRIDRSFLDKRSGVDQGYLIATLKTFGMIAEDGTVLQPLKDLVADRDERQALVAQLLKCPLPGGIRAAAKCHTVGAGRRLPRGLRAERRDVAEGADLLAARCGIRWPEAEPVLQDPSRRPGRDGPEAGEEAVDAARSAASAGRRQRRHRRQPAAAPRGVG